MRPVERMRAHLVARSFVAVDSIPGAQVMTNGQTTIVLDSASTSMPLCPNLETVTSIRLVGRLPEWPRDLFSGRR